MLANFIILFRLSIDCTNPYLFRPALAPDSPSTAPTHPRRAVSVSTVLSRLCDIETMVACCCHRAVCRVFHVKSFTASLCEQFCLFAVLSPLCLHAIAIPLRFPPPPTLPIILFIFHIISVTSLQGTVNEAHRMAMQQAVSIGRTTQRYCTNSRCSSSYEK